MNEIQSVLAVLAGLVVLAGIAGALYVYAKGTAQDARIERLQDERDDYLSRINFIEPRLQAAEEQNRLLRSLHDPSQRLEKIGDAIKTNTLQIMDVLDRQTVTLREISTKVHVHPEEKS